MCFTIRNYSLLCILYFLIHTYSYYHGPYSQIELPDVTYIYRDDIKWRQTRFNHCDDVVLMNKLFLCNIGLTVSFGLCGILGAAIGICGSVCATQVSYWMNPLLKPKKYSLIEMPIMTITHIKTIRL